MAGKKKSEKAEETLTNEDVFEKQLAVAGLSDALSLADEEDDNYECYSTGWPGIDKLIGGDKPDLQGVPTNIHIELYSEVEHVGKTTFALQIGVAWQKIGKKVGVLQFETRLHAGYLKTLGYVTSKTEAESLGIYAVRLMQPKINSKDCSTEMAYVEAVLDTIGIASNYFDLLIIDSVDALISQADSAKMTEDGSMMGGISKYLKNYLRKHTVPIATHIWINHLSKGVGQYAKDYTSGGKGIPRYSTIRFRLDRVDILKENDAADPYGFTTKVATVKNRVSPPFRSTNLTYIFGEGFSVAYDYFETFIKEGILIKNGGWFYIPGEGKNANERKENATWKCQGKLNAYRKLKDVDTEVFEQLKAQVDGEEAAINIEVPVAAEVEAGNEPEVEVETAE